MTAVTEDKVPVGLRELTIRDRATKSRAETIAFIGNTDDNVTVSPIAERMGAAVQPCIMARAECSCAHPVSFGMGYIYSANARVRIYPSDVTQNSSALWRDIAMK